MNDTVIIGGGIAGLTAAIYAARKKMQFEIISAEFGGQFMSSGEILNYPGIVETTGMEFSSIMEKQMNFNEIKVKKESVEKIKKNGKTFQVITNKKEYETKTIIIATGSKPRKLKIPGEKEFEKKGVTYCSICDGPLFGGMDVAIVGSGNSAMEAVDFLKDIASKIYLLVRGDKLKGHEYLQERVQNNSKVEIILNTDITKIKGDKFVTGINYKQKGEEKELTVKGVIIEIGRIPATDPFKNLVKLDEHNHIQIDCQGRTSVEGVFSAGDCASGHEYQYIIAAGQGCMALIKAARYLNRK